MLSVSLFTTADLTGELQKLGCTVRSRDKKSVLIRHIGEDKWVTAVIADECNPVQAERLIQISKQIHTIHFIIRSGEDELKLYHHGVDLGVVTLSKS